ncbi:flavin-containing monooxygenase [Microbacterium suaedae]|uniref:flavin-containing monooxygenase n=1 Tax=Microbacterium suaedae TaxID=2067813 RepID=UPI000DA20222|nr:NAD(P)/FAD-dependent oxidoreductase [Microbacterium suaedae]
MTAASRFATVIVIGAGQAGLSAAFHLAHRGFVSALEDPRAERTFVVFDANDSPGGAWQHRWASLAVAKLNGIFGLPGTRQPELDPAEPSRDAVPRYFADFEQKTRLPIVRPMSVESVEYADDEEDGELLVQTREGMWRTRAVINATGTWNTPRIPDFPGAGSFGGRMLHARDYTRLEDFAGQRVAIVGGGISAIQLLEEISRVAETFWYTRREPTFIEGHFQPETTGRETIAKVTADAEAGRPIGSIVSYTGLIWNEDARAAHDRGALERRPMFVRIEPNGVREADGSVVPVDAILWATGFRADIRHLEPLFLVNELGGVALRGTAVFGEPRVHLIGFGPSQSTVGANRAGREAVADLVRDLSL